MNKITILWYRKETSMNFNGSMYGYKREDGVVGSFSTKLLDEYEKLFDMGQALSIIGTNWKDKRMEELTPEDFNKIGR